MDTSNSPGRDAAGWWWRLGAPDAAELVRAKPGRITGAFITLLTVIKGLPMTYGKDMQEDKEPVFDASDHLGLAIAVMEGMIRDMTVNSAAMRSALDAGYATATDLADWIVLELGLPFRDAHHITGQVVALAEKKQLRLDQLTVDDLQSVHSGLNADCLKSLDPLASVESRNSFGGTAPKQVRDAIAAYSDRRRALHVQLLLALGGVSDGDDEPRDALTQERLAHLVVAGGHELLDARLVILRH